MQNRTFNKILDRCIATIKAICQLRNMDYYYIGYSSGRAAYVGSPGRKGWTHAVVLADKMKWQDALALEKAIHCKVTPRDKKLWQKYHPEKKKDGCIPIHPSFGGHKPKGAKATSCSIYMLWCEL